MNAQMAKVAELDPEYVKRERRREIRFWGALGLAIIAIFGATWAVVVNTRQDSTITRLSQCEQNAQSAACQDLRERAAKAQTLAVACITLEQAGYPCPKPGSDAAKAVHAAGDNPTRHQGGDAPSTGTSPGSQPGPSGGLGNSGGSTNPGVPPSTEQPTGGTPDQPSPSSPPVVSTPTPEVATAPIREAVGGVVTETGSTVNGTVTGAVNGVTGTTCQLAQLLCK